MTVLSQVAMSENALFPLVCVWLIAFAGLLSERERRPTSLWAAGARRRDGRPLGGPQPDDRRRRGRRWRGWSGYRPPPPRARRRSSSASPSIALAVLGVHFLDSFLIDHNYGGSAPDELSDRMDELFQFGGLRTALANLLGQTWYLLVATFGLAARRRVLPTFAARGRAAGPLGVGVLLALTALLLLDLRLRLPGTDPSRHADLRPLRRGRGAGADRLRHRRPRAALDGPRRGARLAAGRVRGADRGSWS